MAKGKLDKLRVFGNDYPTADGTGVMLMPVKLKENWAGLPSAIL